MEHRWNIYSCQSRCRWGAKKKGFDDDEPTDHALGRSRGGFGTKLHLLVDGCGIPLAAAVTAGQAHESTAFETVMNLVQIRQPRGRPRRRPEQLAADRGYDARRIRQWLIQRGIRPVIPPCKRMGRRRPGRPVSYDRGAYRARNVVERCVGWLKECRSVATRFEKLALNYLGLVHMAIIQRYLRLLARNATSPQSGPDSA
jgi:transposase